MSQIEEHKTGVSRRTFLKGAGAVVMLVAAGGVWRAADQRVFSTGEGPAYKPWENWRGDTLEGALALVPAAILASNAHNIQPWLFRIEESRIDLFVDRERNDGAADPLRREQYMSLGCALENLILAAQARGYAHQLTLMPEGSDSTYVARLTLSPGQERPSDLYEAIPHRHTNRYPYDTGRQVPAGTLDDLDALNDQADVKVFWFSSPEERKRIGDLTIAATEAFIADEEQSSDSNAWYRHDWDEIQHKRDGITLDASGAPFLLRVVGKIFPESSREQNDKTWLTVTKDKQVPTAAAFGIIAVRDARDDGQRLRAGRIWQRMHLWATAEKLAMQPLNQINERADREEQLGIEPRFGDALKELLGDPRWQGAFSFRMGYPTETAPESPRRSVDEVVVSLWGNSSWRPTKKGRAAPMTTRTLLIRHEDSVKSTAYTYAFLINHMLGRPQGRIKSCGEKSRSCGHEPDNTHI